MITLNSIVSDICIIVGAWLLTADPVKFIAVLLLIIGLEIVMREHVNSMLVGMIRVAKLHKKD